MLKLGELSSPESQAERLPGLADEHAECFRRLAAQLITSGRSADDAAHALFVPGRIEVLGKHTDYAGGRSLTCATEQGLCLLALARRDRRVEIVDPGRGVSASFGLEATLELAAPDWTRFARAVIRRLTRDFGPAAELGGADIAFASDLPAAAGLSSSSVLIVGLFQALAAANGLERRPGYRSEIDSPEALAAYLAAVEAGRPYRSLAADEGVGTLGGSQDHTAILCSVAERLGQYRYAPVRLERSIRAPHEHVFVVAASGVRASKSGDARERYNRASLAAAAAAREWRQATGGSEPDLASILASGPEAADRLRRVLTRTESGDFTAAELLDRAEHFLQESETLVPQAGDALERGDLAVFGLVADRSQHLARELLGNQVPETVSLAESARELGAVAASSFGAGFGGAVWALVEKGEAEEFAEAWLEDYLESFPEREDEAMALVTHAAGPAREVGAWRRAR